MKPILLTAVMALLTLPALAQATIGSISVDDGIIQEAPPRAMTLSGFATITNNGTEDDRLLALRSSEMESIQIYESITTDGVERMTPLVDGIVIPAGQSLRFGEGGTHPMFNGPSRRFVDGDKLTVTLTFETAGAVDVVFTVARLLPGQQSDAMKSMDGMESMGDMSGH